ncbi:MAG: zinc-ribbon domain-containing protein [Pseudomonadota bacterium]
MAGDQNQGRDVAQQATGGTAGSAPVVEISCPSCDARYRVPAGAISVRGRRVQCASCGEIWRAMPEDVRPPPPPKAEPAAPSAASVSGAGAGAAVDAVGGAASGGGADGPMDSFAERLARMRAGDGSDDDAAAAASAGSGPGPDATTGPPVAEKTAEKRAEQMAEIRRMLDDLKGGGEDGARPDVSAMTAAAAATAPGAAPTRREAAAPAPVSRGEDYVDPLREKLLEPDTRAKKETTADGETQRAGLMRKHQKRSRRRRVVEKTRKSRGGFMTGLSLIVMVGALMTGTYLFRGQIAERLPGSGPALAQYAETVDAGLAQARGFLDLARERIEATLGEVLED